MEEQDPKLEGIDSDESASVVDVHGSVKREKGEPRAGLEPVSLWVYYVAAIVLMLGAGYSGGLYGGFRMDSIYAVEGYVAAPRPLGPGEQEGEKQMTPELWIAKGKKVFTNCAACHMANGLGAPGLYPPLAGSEWATGSTERMAVLILKGLAGPITVKGQPFNNVMQPWEPALSDVKLAQVMSFVRNSWGNSASIVTEEMAAAAREKYLGQVGPWSEAKLREVPEGTMLPGAEINRDDPETWLHLQKEK